MPAMKSVYSKMVDKIGHDPETNELHVEWPGGKVSVYSGVSRETAGQVMNAYSIGKAVNEIIKPSYRHRYL